jgi:ribosomal protein S24E
MELKISNKTEEPLLSRTKLEGEIVFEKATPSAPEVSKSIAKAVGKDEKLIVVRNIYTSYGLKKAKILSYAYENKESMEKIEPRNTREAEKKADKEEDKESKSEQKKEEKAEEKQTEQEPKEEKPGAKKTEQKPAEKKQ